MKSIGNWLRRFMAGRYGTDKLNTTILVTGLILCVIGLFVPGIVSLVLFVLSYGLMIWAIFRSFSRNTYRRYQENRKFLVFWERLTDRNHRYYKCPKCRQSVRVPRGKGKIAITCPRCKDKFIRKT